jgi:small-conductance mechanosensitive channel
LTSHPPQQPWIPLGRIEELVQPEPALLILGLCVGAWLVYKLLLRRLSAERHRNLQTLFRNLLFHAFCGSALFALYSAIGRFGDEGDLATARLLSYLGLFTVLWGATVFVKVCRILAFEYLFLSHMRVAVPLLLVNLFTLLLSLLLAGWIATDVFSVRLAPLLATSAIFSLVMGLALQDTLGNLFAGVALQFDKPYEIGDWIEISSSGAKWVGQVEEISWRATVLIGFGDEQITVPNRLMSQSEIANFTRKGKPVIRSQVVRIPFDADHEKARAAMLAAARQCTKIRQEPAPFVYALEATESWLTYKVVYWIDNYGAQYLIGDEVIRKVIEQLDRAGIRTAAPRLQLQAANQDGAPASQDRAPCNNPS